MPSAIRNSYDPLLGILWTLAPVALVAAVYFVLSLILRRSQRRYYAPRTYLGSLRERYGIVILPSPTNPS
jgi:hypothetical protein